MEKLSCWWAPNFPHEENINTFYRSAKKFKCWTVSHSHAGSYCTLKFKAFQFLCAVSSDCAVIKLLIHFRHACLNACWRDIIHVLSDKLDKNAQATLMKQCSNRTGEKLNIEVIHQKMLDSQHSTCLLAAGEPEHPSGRAWGDPWHGSVTY